MALDTRAGGYSNIYSRYQDMEELRHTSAHQAHRPSTILLPDATAARYNDLDYIKWGSARSSITREESRPHSWPGSSCSSLPMSQAMLSRQAHSTTDMEPEGRAAHLVDFLSLNSSSRGQQAISSGPSSLDSGLQLDLTMSTGPPSSADQETFHESKSVVELDLTLDLAR